MTSVISIIVPIYNTSAYLRDCIDSILSQSYTNFELLLIDDGSTDESGIICDEYAEKDARVKVFHKKNGGVSSARNMGLENAKGEYVYFSDSDDTLPMDSLNILFSGIKDNCQSAVAGYTLVNDDGSILYSIKDCNYGYLQRDEMLMQFFAPSPYQYQGYLVNKLFSHSIIKKHHIRFEPSIKFNEDRLFCVQYVCALSKDDKVYYNWQPVYNYIQRPTSAMASLTQRFNPNFITDLQAFAKMGGYLRQCNCNRDVIRAYHKNMIGSCINFTAMMMNFHALDFKLLNNAIVLTTKETGPIKLFVFYLKWILRKCIKLIKRIFRLWINS